ncbi:diaminopimelate decarboxylase [Pisciglobus halotolerans]|uniref:Diaminopimelate decarboxylase n=1 Tax=Pisciglobus halotolerans TaxID=745365 RepID=A0A1I3BQ77_9LACT|nr:diaminopimelate decarboxylase [Pisciglobus halotolerans]SFH64330.1 diaminopimelate decarboxylase [Pisciglobus halotolerans]
MKRLGNMEVDNHELKIGGLAVSELTKKFGTPLYVIDQKDLTDRIHTFLAQFKSNTFGTHIIYASKAFTNLYMAQLVSKYGLYVDVVSGGELYTALKAGVDPKKIYFHGNNKLPKEIDDAVKAGVGCFVLDNEVEYEWLTETAEREGKKIRVLLRVNPGIEAHTHEYIQTAKNDSKFGVSIFDQQTLPFIKRIIENKHLHFAGLHAHIGSQVFEEASFFKEVDEMIKYAKDVEQTFAIKMDELNLGGGFGVYYTEEDKPFELSQFLKRYIQHIESTVAELDITPNTISIEPGRSLINASGSTLYTIGAVKKTMAGYPYIFVDGGMTDNPRPILYQAKYEAAIANKMDEAATQTYRIAGKCCESGDVLIKEVDLPKAETGDTLVIPSTGAYTYSMSSNYNRIERPAVVFVEDGQAQVAVKRETYEDLIRNDEMIKWKEL